jgi:hypothetical protein
MFHGDEDEARPCGDEQEEGSSYVEPWADGFSVHGGGGFIEPQSR